MRIVIAAIAALLVWPALLQADELTLEQIMDDPDWLGNQPEGAFWGADSQTVFFEQKRNGSVLRNLYSVSAAGGAPKAVSDAELSRQQRAAAVWNAARDRQTWVHAGDVFVDGVGGFRQITATADAESAPMFLADGSRVAFLRGTSWFVYDPATRNVRQLRPVLFEKDPADEAFDVLRDHQLELYEQLRDAEAEKTEARERAKALAGSDPHANPVPVYLGDKLELEGQALSPNGRWLLLATSKKGYEHGKKGSMPNYVTASGHTENRELRTRVGRKGRAPQSLWLIDLRSGTKQQLALDKLPGIETDPLAGLRADAIDYFVERGEDPEKVEARLKAPEQRGVEFWDIRWNRSGDQVALWVHANDNKDRWIASIDFENSVLVSQHRLSDEAWVNPYHFEYGWLPDDRTLWFLSEDHGYLGIYTHKLGGRRSQPLVAGKHVVFDPFLGPTGKYIYYRANVEHPGIYEIWRVATEGGDAQQLTSLGGMNSVAVSPDASKLLITHSEINRHPELYVQANAPGAEAVQITDTMSDAYKAHDWQQPDIVEIPSSHSEQPIYTKIYLPNNHDPSSTYPAVMFVHGAGYTQNSDLGWPYYFREGMFHNLLTQAGYVVIDMDYRASEGYGRDWRTAIYRRMGVPELEDFHDGVNYIVENYGVDRERIGVYGGSYGGFMAFVAMFKAPGLFQSGAALRPVSDWSHYNHGYTSNILNTPGIDPEAYRVSSPIHYVEGLEGSLLIAAGMQDDNVFFQDSVLVVQRLLELKKENFEIALYPQDPHGFVHPESWLDEYRRIFKLFESTLK